MVYILLKLHHMTPLNVFPFSHLDSGSRDKRIRTKYHDRLVAFPCVRREEAKCQNGGLGPKVSQLPSGVTLCACICPYGYLEPGCRKSG